MFMFIQEYNVIGSSLVNIRRNETKLCSPRTCRLAKEAIDMSNLYEIKTNKLTYQDFSQEQNHNQ